jgi:hypothetical protein
VLAWLFFFGSAASAQLTVHGDAMIDLASAVRLETGPLAHVFDEGTVFGTPDLNDDMPNLRIDLAATCRRDRDLGGAHSYFVHFAPSDPGTALGLLSFGDRRIVALAFGNGCFRLTADAMRISPASIDERALDDGEDGLYASGSGTMLAFAFTDAIADSVRVIVETKPSMAPTVDTGITRCELVPGATPKFEIEVAADIDTRVVLLAPWADDCTSAFPSSTFEAPMHELALSQERAGDLIEILCTGPARVGRTLAALLPEENVVDTDPTNNLVECTAMPQIDAGVELFDASVADASTNPDAASRRDGGRPARSDSSIAPEAYVFRGGGGCACSAGDRIAPLWSGLAALVWVWMRRQRR